MVDSFFKFGLIMASLICTGTVVVSIDMLIILVKTGNKTSMQSFIIKAPAKRSQHSAQHIPTLLGATCCARLATLLRHVACRWLKFEAGQI